MSKRTSFMQRFGRQHVNGSQALLRSARNHIHTTLLLILDRGSRKRLALVRSELLGEFVNVDFRNIKKNPEKFFVPEISALEIVAINSPDFNKITGNQQSMC